MKLRRSKSAAALHGVVTAPRATQESECLPVDAKIIVTRATPGHRAQKLYRCGRRRGCDDGKAAAGHLVEGRQMA